MRQPEEIKMGLEYRSRIMPGEFYGEALEYIRQLEAKVEQLEEQVGKDKDVPRKKRICTATGQECSECKPGGPCAKEG